MHGTAFRWVNTTVTVTDPYGEAHNLTLYRTYAALNASADRDLWRIKHPSGCSDYFVVTVEAQNGADVDFYLKSGEPDAVGSSNETYASGGIVRNSTASLETYQQTGVTSGSVYTLMIRHKATNTPYKLTYSKSCGGGGDDAPEQPLEFTWIY